MHDQHYWPECVDTMLWTFSVKAVIEILNLLQLDLDENTPTVKFYNIKNIMPNAHEYHTFGCSVYILNSKPQSGSIGPPKWEPRSRVGVYLGHSPMHEVSVALILNPVTVYMSPQYHVVYNETFLTVSHTRDETLPPTWDKMYKKSVESASSNTSDLEELCFKHLTDKLEDNFTDTFAADSGRRNFFRKTSFDIYH